MHEWVGVMPAGSTQLECPICHTHHGAMKYPFGATGDELEYQCNCGSQDFFIMKREASKVAAVYCRGCGVEATGWFA
jgi:predicted SprT family Zn-dependent metalloprotease